MAYNIELSKKVRKRLSQESNIEIEEKKMFGGLAFMVNGKMCINVSEDKLMCRFNPDLQLEIEKKKGYEEMIMRGRTQIGFCYVNPKGYNNEEDFNFWINLCLEFNKIAKSSKKK